MQQTIYTVELPNGELVDVEGPTGLDEQQVTAFVDGELKKLKPGQKFAKSQPDPEKRPARPLNLVDSTLNTLAGLGEGASALFDLGAQGLGSGLGFLSRKAGLPDWISENLSRPVTIGSLIEQAVPKPEDATGNMVRAISQGVGGAGSGIGLGRMLAQRSAGLTRAVGAELAAQPGGQMGAGIVGAGAAEAAKLGGAPVPIQILTGIAAGGVTPAAMRATAGGVETLANRMITDEGIQQAAARMIAENAQSTPQRLIDLIEASAPVQASGARPTLAEVTLDPGVAGLQRALGNSTVMGGSRISTALADNAIARGNAGAAAFGNGNPAALTTAAEARARSLARDVEARRAAVGPELPPDVAGEQVRAEMLARYRDAKARTSQAYDDPRLQDNPPVRLRPFELSDIADPIINQVTDFSGFQDDAVRGARAGLPDRPQSLLPWVRSMGGIRPGTMGADDLRSQGMGANGQPTLINENGRKLDELREIAIDEGFVSPDTHLDDFNQMLIDEYRGGGAAVVRETDNAAQAAYEQAKQNRDFWRQEFDTRNLDPLKMTDDQWRTFYDDLKGNEAQSRTLTDLQMQGGPGKVMGPFQQTLSALRDRFFGDGGAEAPAYMRQFFREILDADEVGLKTLEGWERRALDMAGNAPDRQTASFMQSVSRAIGARAAMEGGPARRGALEAARGVRREQGETFEAGSVGKALAREDYGRHRVPDSQVGATVVPRGRTGGESVDQLRRAAGDQGAETAVRTEVRRALDEAGTDPRAIARVAAQYRESVNRLPGVAQDLRRARASAVLQRAFERSSLGRLAGPEGRDPNVTVARLLTADDAGQSLRRFGEEISNNPQATEGLRRSIANWIADRTKTAGVDADLQRVPSTLKSIGAIEEVLKRTAGSNVLTSSQRGVLNALRREHRQAQFAMSANRTTGSDTARNIDAQLGILRLATLVPGGEKAKTALEIVLKVAGRTDMLRDVLVEAMVDPKFAAELLTKQHPERLEHTLRRITTLTVGSTMGSTSSSLD